MQFKLRSLFVITGLVCGYCGLVFALPATASLIGLSVLTMLLPPVIVGGIVYGRGMARAFWIGCAASGFIPFLIAAYLGFMITFALLGDGVDADDLAQSRWYSFAIAVCHVLVFLQGLIVIGTRWLHTPRTVAVQPHAAGQA